MQLREHLPARGAGLQAEGWRRVQEPDEDVRVQNPEPRRHARLQGQGAVPGDHGWVPGARLWLLSSAADNRRSCTMQCNVQSWRKPLIGPSSGLKRLLALLDFYI